MDNKIIMDGGRCHHEPAGWPAGLCLFGTQAHRRTGGGSDED